MNCPVCGYAMSPFDQECPRCKNFAAKGVTPKNKPAEDTPTEADEELTRQIEQHVLRQIGVPEQQAAHGPGAPGRPAPPDTMQSPWTPGLDAASTGSGAPRSGWNKLAITLVWGVVIFMVGTFVAAVVQNQSAGGQYAQEKDIIQAARQGSCARTEAAVGGSRCSFPDQMLDRCQTSVHMVTDDEAEVTFTFYTGGVYDKIEVDRDTNGLWHAQ